MKSALIKPFLIFISTIVCANAVNAQNLSRPANVEKRVALVIGNGAYTNTAKLENPVNDANDIGAALQRFGFEVLKLTNGTRSQMDTQLAAFSRRANGATTAMIYYAGHSTQIRGENYLLPVDAKALSEAAAKEESISLNRVLDELESTGARVNIVMLDACRDNPFTGRFRSSGKGLASPQSTPKGTVVVYATEPGSVASDGVGRNGVFTAGLLKAFAGKDLSLDAVLTEASAEVERVTDGKQIPYVNGPKTLQKNFVFGQALTSTVALAQPNAAPNTTATAAAAQAMFATALATQTDISMLLRLRSLTANSSTVPVRISQITELANNANPFAAIYLARAYRTGNPVNKDIAAADFWKARSADGAARLQKLALAGNPIAQLWWGLELSTPTGATTASASDLAESVIWYRKAAEQNDAPAQNTLGIAYLYGRGAPKDDAQAVLWFRKAAEQNHPNAQGNLGFALMHGSGIAKNEALAVEWFRKGADQNDMHAQNQLGHAYLNALGGLAKNESTAAQWYKRAADQGFSASQNNYGNALRRGIGVPKDETQALVYLRLAIEQHNPFAMTNLGLAYANGQGVSKNEVEAVSWFKKAAGLGNKEATDELKRRGVAI